MPAVSLHRVVEVREGQNTAQFDKFPFEKAEKQSFSLIYPQEGTSPTLIVMYTCSYLYCHFRQEVYSLCLT